VAGARSIPPTPAELEQHKKEKAAQWQQKKQQRLQRKAIHYNKWMAKHPDHGKKKDDSSSSSSDDDDDKHGHGSGRAIGHKKDKGPKVKKDKGPKDKKEKKDKGGANVDQDERFIGKLPTSSGPASKWKPPGSAAAPTTTATPAPAPTYSQPAPSQPAAPAPSAVAPSPANVVPLVAPTAPPPPPATPPPDPVATIVLISGCQDNQSSADSTVGGVSFGALTNAFCKVLKSKVLIYLCYSLKH
jgi:hypothetical protein